MDFIRYLWQRAEFYSRISVISLVLTLVLYTIAYTYDSKTFNNLAFGVWFSYIFYMFGYELLYKSLKEKYNTFRKEQDELFTNIKSPK